MEHLFYEFREQTSCSRKHNGYQLLACDGSDLSIFRDPTSSNTYFSGQEGSFGFNQWHLEACMIFRAEDMWITSFSYYNTDG